MGREVHQGRRLAHRARVVRPRLHPPDGVAHERPDRLVAERRVHATTSTASMIPTIAASTAAAFLPSASPAAFPSITTWTLSPTPAPTESIASSVVPRGFSSSVSGCTSISFAPSSFLFFWVDTTVPTTRQICIKAEGRPSALFNTPVIDYPDDRRVGRRLRVIERVRGLAPADEEDVLADAGTDRVERDERAPRRLPRGGQRLQEQHRQAREVQVLHRRDDFADHARELHASVPSPLVLDLDGVHDADDGGVDRAVLEARGHSRGTAADDEHGLAEAGVDRVDRHEIAAFRLPGGIDRARDEQLGADETLVFPRRDDGPYDLGQDHDKR